MSGIVFDASEVIRFGGNMAGINSAFQQEMRTAAAITITEGIGMAQANAPVDQGFLRGSIGVIEPPSVSGGSFGTSVIYAWMREKGGTITGNPWLVFRGKNGGWVRVRSVTQTGTHYMERAANELRPRAEAVYAAAIERVLARMAAD